MRILGLKVVKAVKEEKEKPFENEEKINPIKEKL
jgi:hypothetical protein